MRDVTRVDPELAALVRERLDARQPRLPARFVPPPDRPYRRRSVLAIAVVAFLLGVGVATLIRPDVGGTVLSGVLGRQPTTTPGPAAPSATHPGAAPGAGPTGRPLPSAAGSPGASPTGGGTAPTGAGEPSPQQSGGITVQVSVPPLPLPTPTPKPSPSCILPLPPLCVKAG